MEFSKPSTQGFTIYSKSGCNFCDKAKMLLSDENVTIINCDQYLIDTRDKFLESIKELSEKDVKTFPMIFNNGKFIGGYSELLQYLKTTWSSED